MRYNFKKEHLIAAGCEISDLYENRVLVHLPSGDNVILNVDAGDILYVDNIPRSYWMHHPSYFNLLEISPYVVEKE